MPDSTDGRGSAGNELHDTVQTEPPEPDEPELPPEALEALPDRYDGQDLSLADNHMDATVQSTSTETVTLVDEREGDVYVVELQDIAWPKVNSALSDALKPEPGGGGGTLDFGQYYRDVAAQKIVSVQPEVPEDQLTQWLTGLNERLGKQLQNHLPDPIEDIDDEEAKN